MTLQAMLFDMDGTITRPRLDFPTIKREIGIPAEAYILEALEAMTPDERRRAMTIVERHEEEAARNSELNDGARELVEELARRNTLTGIITRNSRASVDVILQKHRLTFTTAVCREHAAPKPSPDGLHLALRQLKVPAACAVYVGDHTIDVDAGRAAGLRTIWVTNGRTLDPTPRADFVVSGLREIIALLNKL